MGQMIIPEASTLLMDSTVIEASSRVRGDVSADIRERMLTHSVSNLVERVLKSPGTNPRGLIVTITSDPPTAQNPTPELRVVASAPLYA